MTKKRKILLIIMIIIIAFWFSSNLKKCYKKFNQDGEDDYKNVTNCEIINKFDKHEDLFDEKKIEADLKEMYGNNWKNEKMKEIFKKRNYDNSKNDK